MLLIVVVVVVVVSSAVVAHHIALPRGALGAAHDLDAGDPTLTAPLPVLVCGPAE